jgi:hypothetical protein
MKFCSAHCRRGAIHFLLDQKIGEKNQDLVVSVKKTHTTKSVLGAEF